MTSINTYSEALHTVDNILDFSRSESGSASSGSGSISDIGKLGSTGKIHFTYKLKSKDYLMLIASGFLMYFLIKDK